MGITDIYRDEGSYVPVEPVTLAEAKKACLIDFIYDDDLISNLITQCRAIIEDYCKISITPKTITLTTSNAPLVQGVDYPYGISRWDLSFYGYTGLANKWFELPYGPVTAVSSVTNVQLPGTITMLVNGTSYFLRGSQYKQFQSQNMGDTLIIVYTTGYTTCPPALKQAILNEVADRYTNRGNIPKTFRYEIGDGPCQQARAACKQYIREWL